LFDDAPPALQQRVEQVVRLIRSKGVGVYFCSQFPDDVPDEILGQLGNRVQHALRAFTPRDQKAVRTAAETFVANPNLDVGKTISALGVGEALGLHAARHRRRARRADARRTHAHRTAALPHGRDHRCRTRAGARRQPGRREVRHARSIANRRGKTRHARAGRRGTRGRAESQIAR
jgi:hypothetical protein